MSSMGGTPEVKPSKYEKILANINSAKWNDYKARGKPVIQASNYALAQLGGESEREHLAGINTASVEQGLGAAPAETFSNGEFGADVAGIAGRELARGNARAGGETSALVGAESRHQAGLETIISRGRNVEATGVRALGDLADSSDIRAAGKSRADATTSAAWGNLAGTVAGIGLGAAYDKYHAGDTKTPGTTSTGKVVDPSTLDVNDIDYGIKSYQPRDYGGFGAGLGR